MTFPLRTAAGTALLSQSHTPTYRVAVYKAGVYLQDLPILTGCYVTEDEKGKQRRQLSLSVDPLADGGYVPAVPGDILHPLSFNEYVPYRGVRLGDGTTDEVPLGVFRITTPVMADNGKTFTLKVSGFDRSFVIAQRRWSGPYVPVPGSTVGAAVKALLLDRWGTTQPPLVFNLSPTTVTVPVGTTYGISVTSAGSVSAGASSNDPWAEAQALAAAAGMELFFDRAGVVVMRPVPSASSASPAVLLTEGANCTLGSVDRTLDASAIRNGVTVIGTGARVQAFTADTGSSSHPFPAGTSNWVVPAGVNSFTFTLAGGAADPATGNGQADTVTGTVTCSPGDSVQVSLGGTATAGSGLSGGYSTLTVNGANYYAAGGTGTISINDPGTSSSPPGSGATITAHNNAGPSAASTSWTGGYFVAAPGAPVQATAWDTNPSSPTYYLGPMGRVPADPVTDPHVATVADAQAAAAARLILVLASADLTAGTIWPVNPTLDAGDVNVLARARARVNGQYVFSAITTPLDSKTRQTFTNRAAAVSVGSA